MVNDVYHVGEEIFKKDEDDYDPKKVVSKIHATIAGGPFCASDKNCTPIFGTCHGKKFINEFVQ